MTRAALAKWARRARAMHAKYVQDPVRHGPPRLGRPGGHEHVDGAVERAFGALEDGCRGVFGAGGGDDDDDDGDDDPGAGTGAFDGRSCAGVRRRVAALGGREAWPEHWRTEAVAEATTRVAQTMDLFEGMLRAWVPGSAPAR